MLVSKEYKKQLKAMHKKYKGFGSQASELEIIAGIISNYEINSILDYGCGKGVLVKEAKKLYLNKVISGYDPAFAKFSEMPQSADLVISTDVLEHIEPEFIDNVLGHIFELTKGVCYLEIACGPAGKILPDGRNAHLIQQGGEWWKDKLLQYWQQENFVLYQEIFADEKPLKIIVQLVRPKE